MFRHLAPAVLAGIVVACVIGASARGADDRAALRPPSEFATIADPREKSVALFREAAKVLSDPRCMNCHPAGEHPLQGDDSHVHVPAAFRGDAGNGVAGAHCSSCHADHNMTILVAPQKSLPGHPRWQLAPPEMTWEGKSPGDICRQIKDPARNGGRTLALLQEHMATDDLVGWAWNPGAGRRPAPGTQEQLGALVQAWIDTGAECP